MLSSSCFTCLLLLRITIMFKKCCIGLFFGLCQTIIIWKGTFLVFIVIFRFLLVACQVKKKRALVGQQKKRKEIAIWICGFLKKIKTCQIFFLSLSSVLYLFLSKGRTLFFLLSFGVKCIDNRVMLWMNFDMFIT